jgi:anti-sigma factor RsiW
MTHQEMTCQELVELVTEYLEGTLAGPDRLRFEAHLSGCQGCQNYLHQMQQTIHTLGQLTEESLAPEVKQSLLQLFRHWQQS